MPKLAWVLLPLALYGAWLGVAMWRGKMPSRHALNVQLSVVLMVYLLATAGLGIFWVANQQLPVFDWHYLFGYGTLALVALHLWFNLPVVWRTLRGARPPARTAPTGRPMRTLPAALALLAAFFAAYLAGPWRAPQSPPANVAAPDPGVATVLRFHEHSSLSRTGVLARAPGIDWGDAPPPFKRYGGAAEVTLGTMAAYDTSLAAALRGPAVREQPPRLADIAALLHLAAGITARRGGQTLRAAPSSGGLFPSELYVLARRVDGLAPGVYHYGPQRERLVALGPLGTLSGVPSAADADAAVAVTAVFHRTGHKYRERAWRYAVADAGHLLENLRIAAHAAGFHATLAARFDEATLARTLGVDGVTEAPLAVMELRRAPRPPGAAFIPPRRVVGTLGMTGAIQQATSLGIAAAPAAGIRLPAGPSASMAAARAIAERRSKRRFTSDPVPLPVLAALLTDLDQPPQLSAAIGIHIVAQRVQGLAPGVYRYGGGGLTLVRQGDLAAAAQSAALAQQAIGDAAAVLVLAADRQLALADGARGYRHAFLEAGMIGERWLLGATARGLGACPVGAFYDDEAAALIGADRRTTWVLHFAALGVPDD